MQTHSDDLRFFVAVVENGGFTRAAAVLETDNSAVSRSVKRLGSQARRYPAQPHHAPNQHHRRRHAVFPPRQKDSGRYGAGGSRNPRGKRYAAGFAACRCRHRAGTEPPCAAHRGILPPLSAGGRVADLV